MGLQSTASVPARALQLAVFYGSWFDVGREQPMGMGLRLLGTVDPYEICRFY
jgi:hypothetical protein